MTPEPKDAAFLKDRNAKVTEWDLRQSQLDTIAEYGVQVSRYAALAAEMAGLDDVPGTLYAVAQMRACANFVLDCAARLKKENDRMVAEEEDKKA